MNGRDEELFRLLGADALGSRLSHNLHRHGIYTQEALKALPDVELLEWRNVGVSALNRIHERMDPDRGVAQQQDQPKALSKEEAWIETVTSSGRRRGRRSGATPS